MQQQIKVVKNCCYHWNPLPGFLHDQPGCSLTHTDIQPQSAVSCAATSREMFRVGINHWCSCMQPSKKKAALFAKEVCVPAKSPVQMFREMEEVERQILVYWKARGVGLSFEKHQQYKTEHKKMEVTAYPAEALCSGGVNCKGIKCQCGRFELLVEKKVLFWFYFQWKVSLHIYARMRRTILWSVTLWLEKSTSAVGEGRSFIFNVALGNKVCQQVRQSCLEHFSKVNLFFKKKVFTLHRCLAIFKITMKCD